MKNKGMFILVLCLLLLSTVAVSAKSASELIGSITGYVEEIQSYPAVINDALCNGNKDEYSLKMGELADLIQAANDAMAEAGLPNTLNLWAVYGAITANPHCGVHDAALSRADWSREELDRIGYRYGLYDTRLPRINGTIIDPQTCRYKKNIHDTVTVEVGLTRKEICGDVLHVLPGSVCERVNKGTFLKPDYELKNADDVLVDCTPIVYLFGQDKGKETGIDDLEFEPQKP